MKKFLAILVLGLFWCNVGFVDHQVDHWVNLKCKHHDGSGDIEIKFDKKNLRETRHGKIENYKIRKKNNSEVVADYDKTIKAADGVLDRYKIIFYVSRTSGKWIKEKNYLDENGNKISTDSTYYGTCKAQGQAF